MFSGRYKSLLIDEGSPGYMRTACDYVHLNPVRRSLVAADQPLSSFQWSSYPFYLWSRRRPSWLRVDRQEVAGGQCRLRLVLAGEGKLKGQPSVTVAIVDYKI